MSELTAERLRELLHYDPETGVFTWRAARGSKAAGTVAGTPCYGRIQIMLDRRLYLAHRLAWLYVHNEWPRDQLDHADGDGSNNRLANLRACVNRENMQNTGRYKTNTSGLIGVSWDKRRHQWQAGITINYRRIALGRFDSPEAAHQAYLDAKARLHLFQPTPRTTTKTKASNDQTYQTAARG